MQGTDREDDRHSTAPEDPRPRLWRRFLASLALIGLLVGVMIGRLTAPGPVELLAVEPFGEGVQLWFSREPPRQEQHLEGAFAMLFESRGEASNGRLEGAAGIVSWRLQNTERGLLLHFVATRPLRATLDEGEEKGRWGLRVSLAPQ